MPTILRHYQPSDLPALLAIHRAQGFDYALPSLDQFCAARVVENGHGPDTALLVRKSAELYLLVDPALSARAKMERLELLTLAGPNIAADHGITEAYALIPPAAERLMQKRLFQLGWERKLWPMYALQIGSQIGGE
jgi:hypothetical protein